MPGESSRAQAGVGWQLGVALVRWSGLPWLVRNTWARNRVTIFRYHDPDPAALRRQLRYLARSYSFITLDTLVSALEARDWSRIPPRALVVTFDDGWRGNARLFEVCREFGVVPTVYLCSGLVGTSRHFWWTEAGAEASALKSLPPAVLEESLRERRGFGFTREYRERQALSGAEVARAAGRASFQSHAAFHRDLRAATATEREEEIRGSKLALEELVGSRCEHFSYPNGSYDDDVAELVRCAGYRSARTTDLGWNTLRTDPFRLKIAGGSDRGGANAAAASLFGMYLRLLARGSLRGTFHDASPRGQARRRPHPRVLVTDVESRCGLAACRALARGGYEVTAVATSSRAPGHWSRSCTERKRLPDPRISRPAFQAALEATVVGGGYEAVVAGSDAVLLAISEAREALEPHVPLGLPPHENVERATDKLELAAAAYVVGFYVPATIECASPERAAEVASTIGLPLVVKAPRSVTAAGDGLRERVSRHVNDRAALREALAGHEGPVLLQRPVDGSVWSVAGVAVAGTLLATVVSRYARTWPVDAGSVSFSETVAAPKGLCARVSALLDELGWHGIFELELIRREDGSFVVLDLNPRLYGSLALASAAGVSIPDIWCRWLRGENPPSAVATPGVRYRFEDADARHALHRLRQGRTREALATLRPRRRVTHAYFGVRDPLPLVGRAVQIAGGRFERGAPAVGAPERRAEDVAAVK